MMDRCPKVGEGDSWTVKAVYKWVVTNGTDVLVSRRRTLGKWHVGSHAVPLCPTCMAA